MAYCLMGLFDVNMPLLYGEGRKAFDRLQLEIINNSDDDSIFAWSGDSYRYYGMLAPEPSSFVYSGDIMPALSRSEPGQRPPYRMTNRGLEFHLPYRLYDFLEVRTRKVAEVGSIKSDDMRIEFNLQCRTAEGACVRNSPMQSKG